MYFIPLLSLLFRYHGLFLHINMYVFFFIIWNIDVDYFLLRYLRNVKSIEVHYRFDLLLNWNGFDLWRLSRTFLYCTTFSNSSVIVISYNQQSEQVFLLIVLYIFTKFIIECHDLHSSFTNEILDENPTLNSNSPSWRKLEELSILYSYQFNY